MKVDIKPDKQIQTSSIVINLTTFDLNDNRQEKIQLKMIKGKMNTKMLFKVKLIEYNVC